MKGIGRALGGMGSKSKGLPCKADLPSGTPDQTKAVGHSIQIIYDGQNYISLKYSKLLAIQLYQKLKTYLNNGAKLKQNVSMVRTC